MRKNLPLAAILLLGPCSDSSSTVVACLAPTGLSPADRLSAHIRQEEANGFSGGVLVARGDSLWFTGEFGHAARDGHPTAFWIASISKAFAATAIMQLVEEVSSVWRRRCLPGSPMPHQRTPR